MASLLIRTIMFIFSLALHFSTLSPLEAQENKIILAVHLDFYDSSSKTQKEE